MVDFFDLLGQVIFMVLFEGGPELLQVFLDFCSLFLDESKTLDLGDDLLFLLVNALLEALEDLVEQSPVLAHVVDLLPALGVVGLDAVQKLSAGLDLVHHFLELLLGVLLGVQKEALGGS